MSDPILSQPSPAGRRLKRLLSWPLVAIAAFFVLFDDAFRVWVKPTVARIARLAPIKSLEAWIAALPPYGIVTLFIVPLAMIEPMKIAALYLIGTHHVISGILIFILAKIVGVGLAERLFAIGREKLLSIGWFRWMFERAVRIKNNVHAWLASKPFWQRARVWIQRIKGSLAAWRSRDGSTRWAAARRLAGGVVPRATIPQSEVPSAAPVKRGHGLVP